MTDVAQLRALHIAFDFGRGCTAQRDQSIAKKLAKRVVDIFGQTAAQKTEGDEMLCGDFSWRTRAVPWF